MNKVISALRRAGHDVIEWEPYKHKELADIANKSYGADGGRYMTKLLAEEELFPFYIPIFKEAKDMGVGALWDLHAARLEIEEEYFRRWNATLSRTSTGRPMDVLVCPIAPASSRPHLHHFNSDYLTAYNSLEMPAVAVPVLQSDKSIDGAKPNHQPVSQADEILWKDYDVDIYDKGCVGVQVVAKRYNDEIAVAAARILHQALRLS
jgi:amidase